jgi:hypothetical protein
MREYLKLAAMLAIASSFEQASHRIEKPTLFEPSIKPKEPIRPKNHKPFIIKGVEVWALSEKHARDKFNKIKLSL